MKIDITEKLKFDSDPIIQVKDIEMTVNSDAVTILKLLGMSKEMETDPAKALDAIDLLFNEEDKEKLISLGLKFNDFLLVVQESMMIAMGQNEEDIQTP